MAEGERTLVTSFDELRVSDFVEVHCDHPRCGRTHAGILVHSFHGRGVAPDGTGVIGIKWELAPEGLCRDLEGYEVGFCIGARTVARRIVFKIDTGATKADSLATRRTLERQR